MLTTRRTDEADAARAGTNDALCALLVEKASTYTIPVVPLPQSTLPRAIEVAVRVRPLLNDEICAVGTTITGGITHVPEFPNCTVLNPEVHVHSEKRHIGIPDPTGKLETKKFRLHAAFGPGCEDGAIYSRLVAPLVAVVKGGGRAACIAYGQTGSGKTYSMAQMQERAADDLEDLFVQERNLNKTTVSFFELRGEMCYDLLTDRNELTIRQNASGAVIIGGLSQSTVGSVAELKMYMNRGSQLRRTATTKGNAQSSRSHAFCDIKHGEGVLRFVDLAGSERRDDSVDHDYERILEMKEINSSLGNLKECIRLLLVNSSTKKQQYIPYRRSKLTRLLQNELSGGSEGAETDVKTAFLVHISPMRSSLLHTLNTLTYAEAMITSTRADKEKKAFQGTDAWSPKKVSTWVGQLDDGKYAAMVDCFHLSGKMFGAAWINDIVKRTEAAGGTEADANTIYDAFHKVRLEQKKKGSVASTRRKPPAKLFEDKDRVLPAIQDLAIKENQQPTKNS